MDTDPSGLGDQAWAAYVGRHSDLSFNFFLRVVSQVFRVKINQATVTCERIQCFRTPTTARQSDPPT